MLDKKIILTNKYCEEEINNLSKQIGVSPLLIDILLKRGISDIEAIKTFLYGSAEPFHDPFLLKDMKPAVERIWKAIMDKEKITVYGDYDVDGITASSLLYLFLQSVGASVTAYIPIRKNEGYGLNLEAIEAIYNSGTRLIITVDCGISGVAEVASMPSDMDIIITDHHTPPEVLPAAYAVINPHQAGCGYPFKNLAGVGVAFKLCQALYKEKHNDAALWSEMLEFVAMGTVADIVPLIGENREIVKKGLAKMSETSSLGLRELMKICGCVDKTITAETVGFALAPRMNAAGRLEHAISAVELLVTDDQDKAAEIAIKLNNENIERQEISAQIFKEAEEILKDQNDISQAIVLAKEGWHAGVIGIVASRLVDKYHLPTILISIDGEVGKGSCRSIPPLNLYDTLADCSDLLLQFGGHRQAAGLTLSTNNINSFREHFLHEVSQRLSPEDFEPKIAADVVVPLGCSLTLKLVKELSMLEPYGASNPLPVFAFKEAKLRSPAIMGAEKNHLRLIVDFGNESYKGIMWNQAQRITSIYNQSVATLAFSPKINTWNGMDSIDLQLFAIDLKRKIIDYRNYFDTKETLLKNILQKSKKTVVYVNKGRQTLPESVTDNCEIVTYENELCTKDTEIVIFYDLPDMNIFTKESFPLPAWYDGFLFLLFNQNDYSGWSNSAIIKYPIRQTLITEYKYLTELLKKQSVANVKDLITKNVGIDCVISDDSLKIFEELGFINVAHGQISLKSNRKNELSNSRTFCILQEEYHNRLAICQQNMRVTAAQIADIWE
ncbi:MAG: single-stranded-DNA-specific exonuclease RecJ [Acidaminococcaceae bacterium]